MTKKFLLISVLIMLAIGIAGASFLFKRSSDSKITATNPNSSTTNNNPKKNTFAKNLSRGQCQGTGTVTFSNLPMAISDIGNVQPYGIMVGAHVIPTSHGYISPADFRGPRDQYPVYAIAYGYIVNVSHRGEAVGDNLDPSRVTDEYQLWFEHSCTFYTYYDLLTSLSADLQLVVGKLTGFQNKNVRIPIKAGQVVGRIGGQTVDFGVWNFEKKPAFFANPNSYEEDRPYLDDMFKYFNEPLKNQLLVKAVRVVEPRSGRVDYDMTGKMVGGWFKDGSGGFQGPPGIQDTLGRRAWDGHLAIAYDFIDPSAIKFSVGNWQGAATQFAVKGNTPDPATIGVESGMIKYELTEGGYVDGDTGHTVMLDRVVANPKLKSQNQVKGTALAQLITPDKLKIELFPNKTAAEVTAFTTAAQIYTR